MLIDCHIFVVVVFWSSVLFIICLSAMAHPSQSMYGVVDVHHFIFLQCLLLYFGIERKHTETESSGAMAQLSVGSSNLPPASSIVFYVHVVFNINLECLYNVFLRRTDVTNGCIKLHSS